MNQRPKRQELRYKECEEHRGVNFYELMSENVFSDMSNKITNDKKLLTLPRVKPKRRHCQSDTNPQYGEKHYISYLKRDCYLSRIYRSSYNSIIKSKLNPLKTGKELNRPLSGKDIDIANKHVKRYSDAQLY